MDTLKSAVMQQSGSSEVQSPSPDKEQRSSRGKRKNDTKDRYETKKKTKTKKVSGTDKPRKEKKPSESQRDKENSLGSTKKKSAKKEKEKAKSNAASAAAHKVFNANSDCCLPNVSSAFSDAEENGNISPLLPLSPRTNVPTAG